MSAKEGELLPRDPNAPPQGDAKGGEFLPAGEGHGTIDDPHTTGIAAELAGRGRVKDVNLQDIDAAWVLARLVKEATDFGTRTRQSSRVKALELIGKSLGMFEFEPGDDPETEAQKRIRALTPDARRERILKLMQQVPGFTGSGRAN